ncbi:MAG: hypothetical protein ACOX8R_10740 [Bacillota bacterium]|jgi:hypothetical protein
MMTKEEQIQALHARVAVLERQRERRKTGAVGAAGAVLTVCLLFMVFGGGGTHPGGAAGLYSGATMLFEGAGPYVLIAVVAFMAGVIVTVALIKNRKKENRQISENRGNAESEENGCHRDQESLKGRKS